jgi:tetratricopeptide (TPR) repeat protein/predicted Ser/Thr protein kinase
VTHPDWSLIENLFQSAIDLPASERPAFLNANCPNPSIREEVESLIAADTENPDGILAAVAREAQSLFELEEIIGARLGPWRIVRELGRGGMGSVYLGVRDDDNFHKEVAIKLIRHGMDTEDVLTRFRHERQILANLEHPYIARLLDGGAARDGRPFLVMEYVAGQPLDEWCRAHDLTIRDRCNLFLKVCQAVSSAHRNLVVHRDLKPSNILIASDGAPKLLDFGVAKLLSPETALNYAATAIAARPITPDYASPEQFRAEQVTTATDVYSLGAILYEILSGAKAHRFGKGATSSARDIERVICEVDPPAPGINGDLDAIVAMAMRKEPALRYQSVEQFAADIHNYLIARPVNARKGNFTYRAGKYLRRHRTSIAVGALLIFALVGGAATATVQAIRASRAQAAAEAEKKNAERERKNADQERLLAIESQHMAERQAAEARRQSQIAGEQRHEADLQRELAETQRALASQGFGQVRQLAGKFLLDFHNAIATLPGSTPARKMVIETGLQYYDMLVREGGGDRELLEEVARGYDRLGDAQGNPYFANLGDAPGAMKSYRAAEAIRAKVNDPTPLFLGDRIRGQVRIAQMLVAQGDLKAADAVYVQALALGNGAASYEALDALANASSSYGDLKVNIAMHGEAVPHYLRLLEISEQLALQKRNPDSEQRGISLAHTKLGDVYNRLGRAEESQQQLRIALEIDQRLYAAQPTNIPVMRKLYVTYSMLGRALRGRGGAQFAKPGEVTECFEKATELADKMAASDTGNSQPLSDVLMAGTGLGDWLREQKETQGAIAAYRRALDASDRLIKIRPVGYEDNAVQTHQRLATGLIDAAQYDEAMDHLAKADDYIAIADKQNPGLIRTSLRKAEVIRAKADIYTARQQWPQAIEAFRTLIEMFEGMAKRDPANQFIAGEIPNLKDLLKDAQTHQ